MAEILKDQRKLWLITTIIRSKNIGLKIGQKHKIKNPQGNWWAKWTFVRACLLLLVPSAAFFLSIKFCTNLEKNHNWVKALYYTLERALKRLILTIFAAFNLSYKLFCHIFWALKTISGLNFQSYFFRDFLVKKSNEGSLTFLPKVMIPKKYGR